MATNPRIKPLTDDRPSRDKSKEQPDSCDEEEREPNPAFMKKSREIRKRYRKALDDLA